MMLIMKRTIQIIGETLNNESVPMFRFLLELCISSERISTFISIRDNTLSHHRANTVFGKLKIEQDEQFAHNLQKELSDIDDIFQPAYMSEIDREKEFMAKRVIEDSQNISEDIQGDLEWQIKDINCDKKHFSNVKNCKHFYNLLFNIFKHLQEKLDIEGVNLSNDTKNVIETANFLMNIVSEHCNGNSSGELEEFEIDFEDSNKISQIKKVLTANVKLVLKNIGEQEFDINFPCIFSLNDKIKNFDILSDSEKEIIRCKVTEYIKNSADLLKSLKTSLKEGKAIEDVENKLNLIIMPANTRLQISKKINKSLLVKSLAILKKVNEEEDLDKLWKIKSSENILTNFREREELLNMLLKINFSGELKSKIVRILNHKLYFLVDRIDQLKTIFILEDKNITALWQSNTLKPDAGIEKHMKFLMVERYLSERELQPCLEMLLFDCMNILEQRQDLRDLWEKNNHPFKGANIADYLAHGNTMLHTLAHGNLRPYWVSSLISPEDLPLEFINKTIELIKDADAIRAISEMWEKTKLCKTSEFLNAVEIEPTDDDGYSNLRMRIKKCEERWEGYAKLLPLK